MKTTPPSSNPLIVVSACLLGMDVRYDGGNKYNQTVNDFLLNERVEVIPVCPESASGMPSPRPSQEFRGGTGKEVLHGMALIVNEEGIDVTDAFLEGSNKDLARCLKREFLPVLAILKDKSPSCGHGKIYVDGKISEGNGVFAELLEQAGIKVISEAELEADPEFYSRYLKNI